MLFDVLSRGILFRGLGFLHLVFVLYCTNFLHPSDMNRMMDELNWLLMTQESATVKGSEARDERFWNRKRR